MSQVHAPPRPQATSATQVRVLFAEARRRRRRRRAGAAAAVILVAAALVAAWGSGWPHARVPGGARPGARAVAGPLASLGRPGSPLVAWVDYTGRLHAGSLATGRQVVIGPRVSADPTMPLVSAGGRLYWVDTGGAYLRGYGYWPDVVRSLDVATGAVRTIAPGQAVFASPDGRRVLIAWTGSELVELPADGAGPARRLAVPRGWFVPDHGGISFAGPANTASAGDAILVQRSDYQDNPRPTALGLWDPRTGKVRVLGRVASADYGLVGSVTPAGSRGGLVAWLPASCGPSWAWRCLRITSTATESSVTVASPSRYGFALGGALSADGRWLAVFVNTSRGSRHAMPYARLAIVNARTGALRLVPGARWQVGEDILWARSLPGRAAFIAGQVGNAYQVSAATLAARRVSFLRLGSGQDINYSAVVVRPGW